MSKCGDQFRRGKLQIARGIVNELASHYNGTGIGSYIKTAEKALDMVDCILVLSIFGTDAEKKKSERSMKQRKEIKCHPGKQKRPK